MSHDDYVDVEVMFVSPDLNLTYYQYTGDRGDSAMIQLIKDRDSEKLSLYAFIREKMLPLHVYRLKTDSLLIYEYFTCPEKLMAACSLQR